MEYDVIVIGLGPGGEHVAGSLAEAGLSVLGIEERLVGGECPYFGCVPSKMMIRAADSIAEAKRIPELAGAVGDIKPDWTLVADRIRDEATDDWNDQVAVDRLVNKGGVFERGRGRLLPNGVVEVTTADGLTEHTAKRAVVVATGAAPVVPPIPGLADTAFWTNQDIVKTRAVPKSLAVLGGGAIGVELAQVFSRFGAQVTVIEAADHLLGADEPEAGETLRQVFVDGGITVHTGSAATAISQPDDFVITLASGVEVQAEKLLVAVGRKTDPAAVGLQSAHTGSDLRISADQLPPDSPTVFGVGDITGEGAFTHVAMYQANIVINEILGRPTAEADYRALPHVSFTDPEVAAVGLTEAQAREKFRKVEVGTSQVAASSRGWIHKIDNSGFIKLVVDEESQLLVGATVMAPSGGEILSALVVAVHAQVPIADLRSMIYAYPTFHRGIEDALNDLS